MTTTVAGRPGARLVPVAPRARRRWADAADLVGGPPDPDRETDSHLVDAEPTDPWTRR